MKVLLIDPPGWQKHGVNLGLAYLAGAIHSEGIQVQVLDMNNYSYSDSELKRITDNYQADVIGISIKTATANTAIKILKNLKQNFPRASFVVGGPHVSLSAKEFIQENPEIDFAISGDGEIAFIELIKNIQNGKRLENVKGICYIRDKKLVFNNPCPEERISDLPFPRYELFRDIDFSNFRYPLLTSRGCPFNCIFCCVGLISTKKWRGRHPENIIEEISVARQRYSISSFEIMDDNFTYDIQRAKQFCRLLIKKKINLDWWCHNGLRADKLDKELLCLMKRSGCQSIALGIETGDEEVFRNIHKGEELSDILKAVKMIKDVGIKCVGYFIVGLPGDSIKSTKNTVRLQRRLKLDDYKYNLLVPYPGTKIWDTIKESGRMLMDIRQTSHFGDNIKASFETEQLSKEVLEQCYCLATDQDWVEGEENLKEIYKIFKLRYKRDPERILVITADNAFGLSKNIKLEFQGSNVIEAKLKAVPNTCTNELSVHRAKGKLFFDILSDLTKEKYQVFIDYVKNGIFVQKIPDNLKKEFVKREVLPPVETWAKPEGRYFATKLKRISPEGSFVDNGVIYISGIPLTFSQKPEWEKVACGKIESGIAFISLPAYKPGSLYTADYWSLGTEEKIQRVGDESILKNVISECDILFVPVQLENFAFIFSRAKLNVVYSITLGKGLCANYKAESLTKMKTARLEKNLTTGKSILNKIQQPIELIGKVIKVFKLWIEIICVMVYSKIKDMLSSITYYLR